MIQINLLGARPRSREWNRVWISPERRPAAFGLALIMLTTLGIGGWWWHIRSTEQALDATIALADADLTRLHAAAQLVDTATKRKADLAQRLSLIDRLHRVKRDPVELLSAISRSVPDGLWLIELKQMPNDFIQVEGRARSLTAVSDFAEALQTSGRFERPVEIVTTSMEAVEDVTVVRFAVRGRALVAGMPAPPVTPVKAGSDPVAKS